MAVACANWPVLGIELVLKARGFGERVDRFLRRPVRKCQPPCGSGAAVALQVFRLLAVAIPASRGDRSSR